MASRVASSHRSGKKKIQVGNKAAVLSVRTPSVIKDVPRKRLAKAAALLRAHAQRSQAAPGLPEIEEYSEGDREIALGQGLEAESLMKSPLPSPLLPDPLQRRDIGVMTDSIHTADKCVGESLWGDPLMWRSIFEMP
jgi:hypothetical protein